MRFSLRRLLGHLVGFAIGLAVIAYLLRPDVWLGPNATPRLWLGAGGLMGSALGSLGKRPVVGGLIGAGIGIVVLWFIAVSIAARIPTE